MGRTDASEGASGICGEAELSKTRITGENIGNSTSAEFERAAESDERLDQAVKVGGGGLVPSSGGWGG